MKTFKQYLEALFGNTQIIEFSLGKLQNITIYKNPTQDELFKCESETRGLIDKSGNLYILKSGDYIHIDLLYGIFKLEGIPISDDEYDEFTDKGPEEYGYFAVQRIRDTKAFAVGESLFMPNISSITKKYYSKCKIKNPKFLFFYANIYDCNNFYNIKDNSNLINKLMMEFKHV